MDYQFSIRSQFCPNVKCTFFQQKETGNVIIHSRRFLRFKCTACGKTWSKNHHEIGFGFRKKPEKILHALDLLRKGESIRKTARQISVSKNTIQRWKSKFSKKSL